MGDLLVSGSPDNKESDSENGGEGEGSSPFSVREAIRTVLPYFMSIGMEYDEFYSATAERLKAYREAEDMRLDRMSLEKALQAQYIYKAIGLLSPILRTNLSKQRAEAGKWDLSEEYLPLSKKGITAKEENAKKKKYEEMKASMMRFAKAFNDKRKKGGVDDATDGAGIGDSDTGDRRDGRSDNEHTQTEERNVEVEGSIPRDGDILHDESERAVCESAEGHIEGSG